MPGSLRRALLALLAFVLAAGLAACSGSSAPEAEADACADVRTEASTGTAEQVAVLFVTSGVLAQNTDCVYDLVTSKLRDGQSRESLVSGKTVERFPTTKPAKVSFEFATRVRLADQVGSWITLEAPDRKARTFEIVLLKQDDRWLVDYWAPAVGFN